MFCKLVLYCCVFASLFEWCQPELIAETRLSGGQDVDSLRQFPHHVYIIPLQTKNQCGGSILNAQWILTSAGCIKDSDRLELHFGKKNLNAADYFTCSVNSDQVYVYPTNYDDLVLIRLPMMLVFTDTIMPVNISRMSIDQLRNKFVVMPGFNEYIFTTTPDIDYGYDETTPRTSVSTSSSTSTSTPRTSTSTSTSTSTPSTSTSTSTTISTTRSTESTSKPTPPKAPQPAPARKQRSSNKRSGWNDNLKYGMFNIIDNNNCEKQLGSKFDEYTQICAEGWGKNTNSPCDSDYGSGLIVGWPAKSELAGMFSMFSPVCDYNRPAVFTYVAKYLPWIDSMIQG